MKLHVCFSILTVLGLGSTCLASSSRAEVFDWNSITYAPTPAQATTKTALTDTAITDNTLSFQYTLNGGATFSTAVTSPTSASNNDNANYYATSGVATQRSLQTVVDYASSSQSVTETLFFANPVTNATFKLFDVDSGTVGGGGYLDIIKSITGTGFQGGTIYPATVTGSTDNSVTGSGAGFQVAGTATNAQTRQLGRCHHLLWRFPADADFLTFTVTTTRRAPALHGPDQRARQPHGHDHPGAGDAGAGRPGCGRGGPWWRAAAA